MNVCNTGDIRDKEIINLCDGMRLGYATDFVVSVCDAKIIALIVPSCGGFLGLSKGEGIVIPWEKIECIGEDTILVRVNTNELGKCCSEKKKNRKMPW